MTETPGSGHNTELTPEERSALRMHHLRQLAEVDEEIQPLQDRRKKIRKLAKADGFSMKEIDAAYECMGMEDQSIFVDRIEWMIDIAKSFNALPAGTQADLFADRRPADERQYEQGKADGLAGKDAPPADNQHALRGWHDGQAILKSALQKQMEKANAEKADEDEVIPGSTDDAEVPFAA